MTQEYKESLQRWVSGLSDEKLGEMMALPEGRLSDAEFDAVFQEDLRRMQAPVAA